MLLSLSLGLAALAWMRPAFGAPDDVCSLFGQRAAIVNNRLYFMGGNYSTEGLAAEVGDEPGEPAANLYHLELDAQFPVEQSIPASALGRQPIHENETLAYNMAFTSTGVNRNRAIWTINGTVYVFGGDYRTPITRIAAYDTAVGRWEEVEVAGGAFNIGQRQNPLYASAPEAGFGFMLGGYDPMVSGMIRFDASNPDNLSWTNETLENGSSGIEVPNLYSGAMVYIPAGRQGMLIAFGGGNFSTGITEDGWAESASDWLTIYVYDIESHTWWAQQASGESPRYRLNFGTAVSASPDGSGFHITTYGGWLGGRTSRAYEDVYVLSIPAFVWVNATPTEPAPRVSAANSSYGRSILAGACHTYRGSQMIVLGGKMYNKAIEWWHGTCGDGFSPTRVLDLSTYEWRDTLDTEAEYRVPEVIYRSIAGNSEGLIGTIPAAGFADPTLSSLLHERVSATATPSPSPEEDNDEPETESTSSTNTGAIAGGVVGGVAGLTLVLAAGWFLIRKRKRQKLAELGAGEEPTSRKVAEERSTELQGGPLSELGSDRSPMVCAELA
ncbi:hypothetical protein BJY01DRAFT_226384 [Aspergillus pseudoustus]|uniref:Kelch repeat protein n=1 Tax=Aspergillus pseudoustus TaxID=1810923 RepID=A0ABR4IVR4_9EURO